MKIYAKLADGVLVTTCANDEDTDLIVQIIADGFKLYDDSAEKPDVMELQAAVPVYRETTEGISLRWEIVNNAPEIVSAEIARLEQQLAATDYKVVKSFEYSLAGEKIPYDIATIHTEREALRSEIRKLEQRLDDCDTLQKNCYLENI